MLPKNDCQPREAIAKPGKSSRALDAIQKYWDGHIHDLAIAQHPVGSQEFFEELESYRFDKQRHLKQIIDFNAYKDKRVLEIGCSVGIDLAKFSEGGARVTGIDLSRQSIQLARTYFKTRGLEAKIEVMNGECMDFADAHFDFVYAHGVLQYTEDPKQMLAEIARVLRPGGQAVIQVYNRWSWLNALSKIAKVELEHVDAPVLKKYSAREFRRMIEGFSKVSLMIDRFPVKSRLQKGMKVFFYNHLFVQTFNCIPRFLVRPLGWHIIAKVVK